MEGPIQGGMVEHIRAALLWSSCIRGTPQLSIWSSHQNMYSEECAARLAIDYQ